MASCIGATWTSGGRNKPLTRCARVFRAKDYERVPHGQPGVQGTAFPFFPWSIMARTRTTPRRPPKPSAAPLTPAQDKRYSLMRKAGVNRKQIADTLATRGIIVTRQTVGRVIVNGFVNDDVIAAFCELTGTTRKQAWPDVPEYDPVHDADKDVVARADAAKKRRKA